MTDAELIGRILSGEERLFAQVVDRYAGNVWALCTGYIRNRTDCEDVVQESFIQCYRRLDTVRDPGAFGRWLSRLARRQCLAWLRAASRREKAMDRYADYARAKATQEGGRPDEALDREKFYRGIRAQVDSLPAKYREALALYYTAGCSVAEAAGFLGITPNAMKKRLEIGRKKLKDAVADEVERALASDKPREQLEARVIAAIPLGSAAWLGKAGVTATVAAKTGLIGGGVMFKAALVLLGGGLAATGVWYGMRDRAGDSVVRVAQRDEADLEVSADSETEPEATPLAPEEPEEAVSAAPEPDVEKARRPAIPKQLDDTKPTAKDKDEAQVKAPFEKVLRSPVAVEFDGEHVAEIVDFIGQYLKLNMVVDFRVVKPRVKMPKRGLGRDLAHFLETMAAPGDVPVDPGPFAEYVTDGMVEHVELRNVTLLEALEHLLYPLGLDFVVEPGFIWVSTPAKIQKEAVRESDERYEAYDTEEAFEKPVGIRFEGEHIDEILDFVSEYLDLNVVVDCRVVRPPEEFLAQIAGDYRSLPGKPRPEAEYVTDGIVRRINLKNIQFRDMLKALLRPLNLSYSLENGYIWISSVEKIRKEAKRERIGLPETEEAVEMLGAEASVEFEDEHIIKILDFLAKATNAEFAIDASVVQSEGAADAARGDYVTAGTVPYISLKNLPLRDALDALLRQLNLDFVVKDGTIWVSTLERLREGSFEDWDLLENEPPQPKDTPSPSDDRAKVPGTAETACDCDTDFNITLVNIVKWRGGTYRAALDSGYGKRHYYAEGDKFEAFAVTRIDAEKGVVELYSEKDGKIHTLTMSGEHLVD